MLCDHVPLDFSQSEIPGGILQGPAGVEKAVKPVALVRHVPVVEEIVVQESAPDESTLIEPDLQVPAQKPGDQEAGAGGGDRVREDRDLSVLEEILFQLHTWRKENISPVFQELSVLDDFLHRSFLS